MSKIPISYSSEGSDCEDSKVDIGVLCNNKKIKASAEDIELEKTFLLDDSVNVASTSNTSKRSSAISDFTDNDRKKAKKRLDTYAASGLKFSLHGTIFQLQLLMLYTHRGIANFEMFDLATEMDQADKFDDIVVRYEKKSGDNWHWSFLQAKHKNDPQTDRVALKDLIATDSGNFSITKYFISFCRIVSNPTFKDGTLEDFILCTNTSLDLVNRKRKLNASLSTKEKTSNEFDDKWEKHLTCSGLSEKCILFCHNNTADSKVYRFNSTSFDELSTLMKSAIIEKCISCVFLNDLKLIEKALKNLQRQQVLKDALACIEYKAKSSRKNEIKLYAKKILKFSETLADVDFNTVKTALNQLQKHKGKSDKLETAVYTSIENLETKIKSAAAECDMFVESLKDKSSVTYTKVNEDVAKLTKPANIATVLRSAIMDCTKVADLKFQLENGIQQWCSAGICVPPKLSELAGKIRKLKIEVAKSQCQNIIDTLLGQILMIEIICIPSKFALYLQEFLKKFQFIVNYPDVTQLNIILKTEIADQFCLLDANLLSDSFERYILEWFMKYKNGKSTWLSRDQGHSFFQSLRESLVSLMTSGLNKAYLDKLHSYNMSFQKTNDSLKHFLQSDKPILLIYSRSTRLSSLKALQTLKECEPDWLAYQDSFICVRLNSLFGTQVRQMVCDAFSSKNKFFLIIVECQIGSLEDIGFRYACEGLLCSLKSPVKKIIFISSDTDFVSRKLKELTAREISIIQDKTEFNHLNKTSQTALLNNLVLLQNETVALGDLLDAESASAVIDEQVLQHLVERKKIEIDDVKAFSSTGYDPTCYIERCLHHQKLTNKVFSQTKTVFLLTGMAKEKFSSLGIHSSSNTLSDFLHGKTYDAGFIIFPPSSEDEGEPIFNHLVQHKRPNLEVIWIESIEMDFYWRSHTGQAANINPYVADCKEFPTKNEQTFASPNLKQKVVIVSNEPGMGKSTFITSLSRKMKTRNKNLWIARVNLNDHAFQRQLLSDIDNRKFTKSLNELPAVIDSDFICDIALWSATGHRLEMFQRKLFKLGIDGHESAQHPKIVIFFDGFDEVCPTYRKQVMEIVHMLENSALAQIWITTRTQEKVFLEEALLRPAHVLSNLTIKDKIWFLSKYWLKTLISNVKDLPNVENAAVYLQTIAGNILKHLANDQGVFNAMKEISPDDVNSSTFNLNIEESHFEPVSSFFVDQWNYAIRDSGKSFIDNPLQLHMLGQIVIDQNFELPAEIGLTSLFDIFVRSKINIYFYGKGVLGSSVLSDEISEDQSKVIRQDLSIVALNILFPDGNWPRPVRPRLLARAGLLILYSDSHFQFMHRSFADYFVADLLAKNLEIEEFQSLLLKTIFIQDEFFLITAFLNEMLIQYPNQDVQLSKPLLEEILLSSYRDTFLHKIVHIGYLNLMKFFIDKLFAYPDICDALLLKPGTFGTIPLYTTFYNPHSTKHSGNYKTQTVETFLSLLTSEHVVKILTHFHAESLILLNGKIREVTMLQVALMNSQHETTVKTLVKQIVTRSLLKSVFAKNGFAKDGNIFHFCSRVKKGGFMNLLQMVTDIQPLGENLQELMELLLMKDSSGRTPLHWLAFISNSATTIPQFLEWLILHTENAKINRILDYLKCTDEQNLTPVEISVYRNNTKAIDIFMEFLEKHFSEQYNGLFTSSFHQSLLHKSISQGKTESVTTLIDYWFKRLQFSEFKDHLLNPGSDSDRRTSLTLAAARNFHLTVQTVFNWLEKHLHVDSFSICVLELMQCRDRTGGNILHESIYWKRNKVVDVLLKFIYSKCDLKIWLSVLFAADHDGNMPFDISANLDSDTYQKLFNIYEIVIAQIWADDLESLKNYFTLESVTFIEKFLETHYIHGVVLPEVLKQIKHYKYSAFTAKTTRKLLE